MKATLLLLQERKIASVLLHSVVLSLLENCGGGTLAHYWLPACWQVLIEPFTNQLEARALVNTRTDTFRSEIHFVLVNDGTSEIW